MGKAVFHLGPLGAGHAMKCLNNLVTALNFVAVTEGLAIGKRYGLDPAAMVDVLDQSTGMSWISKTHIRQRVLSRRFDDPFKLALMLKDIGIATQLARSVDVPAPLSALGQELWRAAALDAAPDASVSELARWVERLTGTEITPGAARAAAVP
ncbi:MAG: NAD-binding protein, partial [Pseudomonadota bacterium]|nr:NAD-binding protein [Pseudomonadota bacterium]